MTIYAIDINNHKISAAMKILGIDPSELIQLSYDDFYERNADEDIQKLRYDHYIKKLNDTVKLIKNKIKESRGWSLDKVSKETKFHIFSPEPLNKSFNFEKLKEKHKEIICNALNDYEREIQARENKEKKLKKAWNIKEKLQEKEIKLRKSKLNKFVDVQKRNIEDIKRKEQNSLLEALKSESSSPVIRKSPDSLLGSRKINSVNGRRSDTKLLKTKSGDISEEEIEEQLTSIYKKIEKSKGMHDELINRKKSQISRKHSEINVKKFENSDLEAIETAIKLISRHKKATERRAQSAMKQQEARNLSKRKYFERFTLAQEKLKEKDDEIMKNLENFEKKAQSLQKLLETKKAAKHKNLELKVELHRLKTRDTQTNRERHKRIMLAKRDHILGKQHESRKRIKAMRSELESSITTKRANARKVMIEKEKMHEILAIVSNHPESRLAKQRIKEMSIQLARPTSDLELTNSDNPLDITEDQAYQKNVSYTKSF
ncbi:unnamed protein product [Blepharisma stoltei]|uniref:Uncharacterized protein n=1 Tax=Blepharisma stoltei TaxID=1481888 RepID=A0AAU9KMI7_9CILI|nr:unnamed protein product [Blepharisma stoltei]